jgi:tetratricopeptide (TPR) repeat protein
MIDDLLRRRIEVDGVEAAVEHYRVLRRETHGDWSYDFGEWVINDLAAEFLAERADVSAALVRMNVEFHPESASAWSALAGAESAGGDRDAAIAAYRKGLELAPENPRILRALRELGVDP